MGNKKQELADRKRQDIIQAGIDEFREKSFMGARTATIAKRANVSSRTLYKHFDSKEALFVEIVDIMFSEASKIPTVDYDPNRPLRDQFIKAVERFLDYILTDHMLDLARMTYAEFLRDTELAQEAFAQVSAHDNPIRILIVQAMEAGAMRTDEVLIAQHQLTSMIKALFHAPVLFLGEALPIQKSQCEVIEDCVDMFLSHYQPD